MKMKLLEPMILRFGNPDWASNPAFGLLDTILERHLHLIEIVRADIVADNKDSTLGRGDSPSVEQIMRAALYKALRNYDYRELEYAQIDSRICEQFVKIDTERPYSFQVYHKYISRITEESLSKLMVEINKIAIENGIEDLSQFREDSTVVETNIHYPTNNSLVWDCIKESDRFLQRLKKKISLPEYKNNLAAGKKTFFKINVEKSADKRIVLFQKQLELFMNSINQVSNIVGKKQEYVENAKVMSIIEGLERLLSLMRQVYDMTYTKEIRGEQVPNSEKIFSIYEQHTDIIIKGQRECKFGHKVDIGTGSSNLIVTCRIPRGNPGDVTLFQETIEAVKKDYGIAPESVVTDGGYASFANQRFAVDEGIKNIVFNKITRSIKNIAVSSGMEETLKRWRSGIESVISNLKRGYSLVRCNWKGWKHFQRKVYWSIIAYNIRVMTGHILTRMPV